MSPTGSDDHGREGEALRRVTARAIRRLDILEWVILAVAATLATGAGALVAFLLTADTELPFRPVWMVASILFFVVPAALARWTDRRSEHEGPPRSGPTETEPTSNGR